jgi:hypothetical protein
MVVALSIALFEDGNSTARAAPRQHSSRYP